jgi:hypothetical protein
MNNPRYMVAASGRALQSIAMHRRIDMTSTWRRWLRTTGCFAGAGLLLALATVPSGAQEQPPLPPQPLPQQQPQQQQPQRKCFAVEMSHSTQGNPQGSILLDRCTGKTWLLLCIRNDTAGCAFQWAPIPDATEPAAAGRTSPPAASPPAAGDWR